MTEKQAGELADHGARIGCLEKGQERIESALNEMRKAVWFAAGATSIFTLVAAWVFKAH